MSGIVDAIALPDIEDATARPIRMLADLAESAMRMVRLAVEQYEGLTTQAPQKSDTARPRKQPDPGTLFTRAARLVLDCITKEYQILAGFPLAPAPRPRSVPRAECCAPDTSCRNDSVAEPVRQALRTVTRNHPHGEKLLREGLEHLQAALAAQPMEPSTIPELFRRVCAATGIRLDPARLRKIARDPAFESLAAKATAPP